MISFFPISRIPIKRARMEISATRGELGMLRSREIMPLAMAHTEKLRKFGA